MSEQMGEKKMDFNKVLAILSQPQETPPPLEHVKCQTLDIPYITKDGAVDTRKARIYIPEGVKTPMPLIYIPHYEMMEDAVELRTYLSQGWAVASPTQAPPDANARITDNDLVFNNAALYTLRQMDEFDSKRIILVGGSAGGYMTLMMMGQNLGLCAAIANGPIANTYFNLNYYFPMAQKLNMEALAKIMAKVNADPAQSEALKRKTPDCAAGDEKAAGVLSERQPEADAPTPLDIMKKLASVPIPFIAALCGQFAPALENFQGKGDTAKWEALSGVGIAGRFSNPLMVNHNTSDVLVPVDQISRRFTYIKPGNSLPEDFDARLPGDFPGKLKNSLEECLPASDTRTIKIPVSENAEECDLPYDSDKRFNLNIFDDGPMEGYGSHSARMDVGRRMDAPYLKEMVAETSAQTCILTPDMLKFSAYAVSGKMYRDSGPYRYQ